MRINILGATIKKEVTVYYAQMKDDPYMNHFYFDYSIEEKLF